MARRSRWQDIPVLRSLAELIPLDKIHDVLCELEDCVDGCQDGVDNVLEAIDCLRDDKTYETLIADLQSKNQNSNGGVALTRHVDADVTDIHRSRQSYQLAKELSSYGSNVVSLSMRLPDLTADDSTQMENCTAWCEFIQKSNLKKMHIFWDKYAMPRWGSPNNQDIPSLGTSLFNALADCKGLEVVRFSGSNKLPMKCFGTFLSVAKIRRLNVCSSVLDLDALDFGAFAEGLGSSQTLETVDLRIHHEREASLFPQLAKIPCLKEVNLSFGPVNELEYRVYLCLLLEQSTALCRLTLTGVCFSRELMEALTMALAGRQGMTKLTLEQCNYPDDSDFVLVKYLQTCSLNEFGFGRIFSVDESSVRHHFSLEAWAELLFEPSALPAVRFTRLDYGESDLIHWLETSATMIQVKDLRFDVSYDIPTWLLTCIERFRHVQNLQVVTSINPYFTFTASDIKPAVKNNTSLRSISMLKEHEWDDERLCPLLTRSQEDVLAAYCQRNECLPALLASHDGDSVFPLLLAHVGDVRPNPALVFLQGSSDLCVHHDRVAASSASFESRRDKKRTLPDPD